MMSLPVREVSDLGQCEVVQWRPFSAIHLYIIHSNYLSSILLATLQLLPTL